MTISPTMMSQMTAAVQTESIPQTPPEQVVLPKAQMNV